MPRARISAVRANRVINVAASMVAIRTLDINRPLSRINFVHVVGRGITREYANIRAHEMIIY